MFESPFNKVAGLKVCNFIDKRLQQRCFSVNTVKFLRTAFFTKHLRWLLLYLSRNKFSNILLLRIPVRSSPPELIFGKSVLKICSKFTGEHPCQSVILIKLQNNFIEITLRHGCFFCKFAAYFQNTFS